MPFAAALSTAADLPRALDEVSAAPRFDGPIDLAVCFFSPHHAAKRDVLAAELTGRLQPRCLFGCVGESVIGTGREVERTPALSVWLARFVAGVELDPFHLVPSQTPDGLSLLGWPDALLDADPKNAVLLTLGDPFTFPAAESFLPTLDADHRGLRVFGGMASGVGPGHPALVLGTEAVEVGAVGVLLRGPVGVRGVVSQGCRPIGRPLVVTKGHDNIIQELGGRTPLEWLREIYQGLSPRDQALFQGGLHVGLVIDEYRDRFDRGDFLIRNVYGLDRDTGALAITDRIRAGQTVQFQVRDAGSADDDLRALLQADRAAAQKPAAAALVFSCNGRGTRLFANPDHDASALAHEHGPVPTAGFFAAGELGPVGGRNFLHGFTASIAVFEE
jgi:small ligand-binding sensory domain FIST